jgi:hypothetical protein
MKETLASNERVIGIEVHHQDEMTSAIGNKFISHFSINSFPSFRVNNDKSTLTSTLTRKPEVGLYLSHKRSGNSLVIESYVKALMDLKASEYYIAVYIMEDGKVAPQYADDHSAYPNWTYENKRYPGYVHDNILRDEASNQTFGQLLHNGPMRKDLVFKHTVEIDISQEFIDVYPLLVIWKRENREYTFVNALRG